MKKLLYILLALVVVVGAGVAYLWLEKDNIIRNALESYGPDYTGTPVRVAEVKLQPQEGRATIRGLEIGNPPGFSSDYAVRVGEASVKLEIGTLTGREVVVNEITVGEPDVNFEAREGGNNLQTIQKNLETATATDEPETPDEERTRLVIERFVISGAKATVVNTPVVEKSISVTLDRIERTNIGTRGNGVLPEDAANAMLRPLIDAVMREAARGAIRRVLSSPENVIEGVKQEGIVGGAKEGLKNLLKKPDEE